MAAVQTCTTPDPARNLARLSALIDEAIAGGAAYVQTPEMSNVFASGEAQAAPAVAMDDDPIVAWARTRAREAGVTIHLGSIAVRREGERHGGDARLSNRAVVIGPDGAILATYDKAHMFDADPAPGESYRESARYAPGTRLVAVDLARRGAGPVRLGLSICFDVRFPMLYRRLAQAGAEVIAVPSAFSATTGPKHWEVLLRARAIETGAFVIAAAQGGTHETGRRTHGHSLIVAPDGCVLAERASGEGVILADLDLAKVARARVALPVLADDGALDLPLDVVGADATRGEAAA